MPKQNGNASRKRRTRQHLIADLAINHVERHVLHSGHTLQRVVHDYGLDAIITTFNGRGEVENGLIWLQVKATDHPDPLKAQNSLCGRIERKHLLFWIGELFPVILIVYDATKDRAHWLHVQDHFAGGTIFEAARSGTSVTLQVPLGRVVDGDAVNEFRQHKAQTQARFKR